ncbi:MAG: hypothetical protein ACYCTY_09370 [Sulfuricella sp.]
MSKIEKTKIQESLQEILQQVIELLSRHQRDGSACAATSMCESF